MSKLDTARRAAPLLLALVQNYERENADAAPCVDQSGTGGAGPATSESDTAA